MAQELLISTWSFGLRGHRAAWPGLVAGGTSLDAVERVCTTIEADPEVDSVGFGGLPDASGRVTLDAAVMLGPSRFGAVAGVGRFLPVASIARRVMEETPHRLLVGTGAEAFAEAQGFPATDLLSETARNAWERWTRRPEPREQGVDRGYASPRPVDVVGEGRLFSSEEEARWRHHDTIGTLAIDGAGTLAGACSTSGTPYKLPGRVGDSPIVGHALYVDPAAGAAVATGCGELVMGVCGAFLCVELLRRGATPAEAVAELLTRIADTCAPTQEMQVGCICLSPDGAWSAASLRPGFRVSVTTKEGERLEEPGVWERSARSPGTDD